MSNDESRNPKLNDEGRDPLFRAFQNLNLRSNNEQQESGNQGRRLSENNQEVRFRGSNHNSPLSASNLTATHLVLDYLLNLMKSPSHNQFKRFVARIYTYGWADPKEIFLRLGILLTRNRSVFLDLALSQHGSGALYFLLRRDLVLDNLIWDAVCGNFLTLMNSPDGCFLISSTIQVVDEPRKEIIYKLTYENTLLLAEKEIGSAALCHVFDEIRGQYRELILDIVSEHAFWLAFHRYGAFVVQDFLRLENQRVTQAIADNLYGSFINLAMMKLGSYVVQNCMNTEYGTAKVLEEFRRNDGDWIRMANDRFGNLVAQKAIRVMKQRGMKDLLREFVEKLRPYFVEMMVGFGKNTVRLIHEEIELWLQVST